MTGAYAFGILICLGGIQRLAISLLAARASLREGQVARGIALIRIGLPEATGIILWGAQLIALGIWREERSWAIGIAGTLLVLVSALLRFAYRKDLSSSSTPMK